MRFLVTGGAGFIGSHIVDRLIAGNHEAVVLDNFSSGARRNIEHHKGDRRCRVIEADIRNFDAVDKACAGVDGVFHEAALVSVPLSMEEPKLSFDINSAGTFHVLEAARRNGVGRVVLASSAAVYGDNPDIPLKESETPAPLSPYGHDKLNNERQAAMFSQLYGISAVALRYFNVFGPRQDPGSAYSGVISIFADRARRKEPLTIHGDGEQTRDFVFVEDVVEANMSAMLSPLDGHEVYNVGTGSEISVKELAAAVIEITGSYVGIEHAPKREGDIYHSVADTSKIREALGFEPAWSFRDGLEKTLASLA